MPLKVLADENCFVFFQRTGMRLLFRNADFLEDVQNRLALDFQFARQIVDSNLTHPPSRFFPPVLPKLSCQPRGVCLILPERRARTPSATSSTSLLPFSLPENPDSRRHQRFHLPVRLLQLQLQLFPPQPRSQHLRQRLRLLELHRLRQHPRLR